MAHRNALAPLVLLVIDLNAGVALIEDLAGERSDELPEARPSTNSPITT
jgi:hypothetical protein